MDEARTENDEVAVEHVQLLHRADDQFRHVFFRVNDNDAVTQVTEVSLHRRRKEKSAMNDRSSKHSCLSGAPFARPSSHRNRHVHIEERNDFI